MDFLKRNRLAIILIIGALLTLTWAYFCPQFDVQKGTTLRYGNIERRPELFASHIDLTYFIPGLVVIWTGEIGVVLLLTGTKE